MKHFKKSIDNRSNEQVNSFLIYINTVLILNSLGANLSYHLLHVSNVSTFF